MNWGRAAISGDDAGHIALNGVVSATEGLWVWLKDSDSPSWL
jgi:hypothetical protein